MYRPTNNSTMKTLSGQSRMSCRVFVLLCIVLLVSGVPQSSGAQSTADEYQVKAAFLFHFAQFVEWPANALNAGDPSFKLCIFDDDLRRHELQSPIEGKSIGARVFRVHPINQPQEIQGCDILFLSHDNARPQSAILRSLHGTPILTVGETSDFLTDGGIIRFHLVEGKIRFDINLDAAESSHLKISSRLLLLATAVTRGGVADRGP